jgi:hypothetical protein
MNIEKGIPLPTAHAFSRIAKWHDVAVAMEHGDSIAVEDRKAAVSLLRAINRRGMFGRCQKLNGDGYRVWASNEPGKGAKRRKNFNPN